jgi:nitroreductase
LSNSSDLFAVLKARHSCRNFDSRPIRPEILRKLIYAAHRASTAGNVPYRFIIVVNDPIKLKMLRLVSPGYSGDSSAAIVVCTNLRVEREITKVDTDRCSAYDAGAAAENVVLAAYAMGLGALFIKSYSETAVKKLLDLPEECRTDLIIPLGYPARDESTPVRARTGGKITYLNKYGAQWKNSENVAVTPGKVETAEESTLKDGIFTLALFLVTSARGCVKEPHVYGPVRLLDAVCRLADLYSKIDAPVADDFLVAAKQKIMENDNKSMVSEDDFVKFIDDLVIQFTDELIRRHGK